MLARCVPRSQGRPPGRPDLAMGAARAFRQEDLTRAIKGAKAAGMRPHVIIQRDGTIHIIEAGEEPVLTPQSVEESVDRADEAACDNAFG